MATLKEEVACFYCGNYIYYPDEAEQGYHERCRSKHSEIKKQTGHFTGKCSKCGSSNLWDDNTHYGCNTCDSILA